MTNITQLTQLQKDIVVGTLLGDASMSFSRATGNASYICEQSTIHTSYLQSLFEHFREFISSDVIAPVSYTRLDVRNGVTSSSLRFSTVTSATFFPFVSMFYTDDSKSGAIVKRVPSDISELLTPRALAYWIMDDGQHVVRGGVTLCTDNFSKEDIKLLAHVLSTKYGLKYTFHREGKRIYISRASLGILRSLVLAHMHPSFLYKIHL